MEDGGDEGFGGSRGHRSLSRREAGDGDEGSTGGGEELHRQKKAFCEAPKPNVRNGFTLLRGVHLLSPDRGARGKGREQSITRLRDRDRLA